MNKLQIGTVYKKGEAWKVALIPMPDHGLYEAIVLDHEVNDEVVAESLVSNVHMNSVYGYDLPAEAIERVVRVLENQQFVQFFSMSPSNGLRWLLRRLKTFYKERMSEADKDAFEDIWEIAKPYWNDDGTWRFEDIPPETVSDLYDMIYQLLYSSVRGRNNFLYGDSAVLSTLRSDREAFH